MERSIEAVVQIRRLGEEDPRVALDPARTFAEIEELRRMHIHWTGDPDLPLEPYVRVRRLSDAARS